eukprot:jgi/Hompol1/6319/HPOL_001078-RA
MLQSGPSIAQDQENFFESDHSIELRNSRRAKDEKHGRKGAPIKLSSKVLALELLHSRNYSGQDDNDGKSEKQLFAYVGESGHIARKVELPTGRSLVVFRGHSGPVTSLAVVLDTSGADVALFTGSWDKTIRKWRIADGAQLLCISHHTDFVKRICLHGNVLFSASADKSICKWNADSGELLATLRGHTRSVEDLLLTSDGAFLYSASSDRTIRKWDAASGSLLAVMDGHETSVYGLALSPDESELWSVSADKTAKQWDLETNQVILSLEHPDFVKSILVVGESGLVATGCRDENMRLWNIATEECVKVVEAHSGEISSIKLSQGSTILSASLDGTLRSWPLESIAETAAEVSDQDYHVDASDPKQTNVLSEEEERELAELMDDM